MSQSEISALRLELTELKQAVARLEARLLQVEARAEDFEVVQGSETASSTGETKLVTSGEVEERTEVAKLCGQFLWRAVNGLPRGSSGRDRLQLQNRCYVIVKDFAGTRLPEPVFCTTFDEVRKRCKKGAECGDSVFLGFASKWEARLALETAQLPLPAGLRHG